MRIFPYLFIYLAIVNIIGFLSMYIDKQKAIKKQWRIPEARLFMWALLGGSLGSNLGMQIFRHKTKHWYFVIFMPAILIADCVILYFVITKLI